MSKQHEPPALPGEAWRGIDSDGDVVAVTITDGSPCAWYIDLIDSWERCAGADIFAAWAMAERARAEQTEREACAALLDGFVKTEEESEAAATHSDWRLIARTMGKAYRAGAAAIRARKT